jgi:hypothetical protein
MPNIPQSPLQDGSAMTDADLVALLAGERDVAPELQPVADVLAALTAEPGLGELVGEARAVAEFRRRAGVPARRGHARRRTAGLPSRLSVKAAAGAAAATLVLGGAATAAFANMLPAPIQRFAHDFIGAPDAPATAQPVPARAKPTAPGQVASHGTAKSSAKQDSTSRHPNRHGHGQPGTGQGQLGNGQGQQGAGQGQQGQGEGQSGAGHAGQPGAGHPGQPGAGEPGQPGTGQGRPGTGLADPHAMGRYGDPHLLWQQGDPHPLATPIARHARPAWHRPAAARPAWHRPAPARHWRAIDT